MNKWMTTTTALLLVAGSFTSFNTEAKALKQAEELQQVDGGSGGGGGSGAIQAVQPVKDIKLVKEPIKEQVELPLPEVAIKEFDVKPDATLTAAEQSSFETEVSTALTAIQACSPYTGNVQNAKTSGQLVKMQVHGKVDGKCHYTAEVASEGLMTCMLSADHTRDEDSVEKALEDRTVCYIREY